MKEVGRIRITGRAWTINDAIRNHRMTNAKRTRILREAAQWLWLEALGNPKDNRLPTPLRVVVRQGYANRIATDVGASVPAVKAALDGLVDVGYIPDDNPEYIAELTFRKPLLEEPEDYLDIVLEVI